jgi:hypothetical protein
MKTVFLHTCVQLVLMTISIGCFKILCDNSVLLFTCGMFTQLIITHTIYNDK